MYIMNLFKISIVASIIIFTIFFYYDMFAKNRPMIELKIVLPALAYVLILLVLINILLYFLTEKKYYLESKK